jgi:putative NADH-flavin reductase
MVAQSKASMRLFILGATGRVGWALVDQAIDRGHTVTAFVRSPEKLGALRSGLTVRKGDPCSVDELRAALPDHDAVLSALGPVGLGPTMILRECARSTVAAMQAAGIRRLLIVSAAVLFENEGLLPWFLRKTFLRNIADDSAEMERVVIASGLDWTIVRPPRLTNGRLTGHYAIEIDRLPRGGRAVSRADVADFLLEELERGAHVRRIVGMGSTKSAALAQSAARISPSRSPA